MKEKEFPLAIAVALMSRYGLDADGNISKSELEFYTKDATEADFASVVDLMVDQNKRRAA